MDGNATAEAFITHQWLPDSPKTPAHGGTGGTLVGKPLFNETIRYRRGAVGCSWLFHRHRVHSATVARPSWPARLPPKSVKISIRHGQALISTSSWRDTIPHAKGISQQVSVHRTLRVLRKSRDSGHGKHSRYLVIPTWLSNHAYSKAVSCNRSYRPLAPPWPAGFILILSSRGLLSVFKVRSRATYLAGSQYIT